MITYGNYEVNLSDKTVRPLTAIFTPQGVISERHLSELSQVFARMSTADYLIDPFDVDPDKAWRYACEVRDAMDDDPDLNEDFAIESILNGIEL